MAQCPLMAINRHRSGATRRAAFDPKRTFRRYGCRFESRARNRLYPTSEQFAIKALGTHKELYHIGDLPNQPDFVTVLVGIQGDLVDLAIHRLRRPQADLLCQSHKTC